MTGAFTFFCLLFANIILWNLWFSNISLSEKS